MLVLLLLQLFELLRWHNLHWRMLATCMGQVRQWHYRVVAVVPLESRKRVTSSPLGVFVMIQLDQGLTISPGFWARLRAYVDVFVDY